MRYDPSRGDSVLRRALETGDGFGQLPRFVDAGWPPDPLIPLLESSNDEHRIAAAFVLAESQPAAVRDFVVPVAESFAFAPALARHDLLDYLIRQPRSAVRDATIAFALADGHPVVARNAAQEICRWPESLPLEDWSRLVATAIPSSARGAVLSSDERRRAALMLQAVANVRQGVEPSGIAYGGDACVRAFVDDYRRGWRPTRAGRHRRAD